MKTFKFAAFPKSRLAIVSKVEELCRRDYADDLAENPNMDLVAHVGEWHMENVSEAGYSEAREDGRRSVRAFARIFRFPTDELNRVKEAVGWNTPSDEYREFGFASLLTQLLSHSPEYALALKEAYNGGLEPKGPYGRGATLNVMPSLVALGHEYQMEVGDLPDTEAEFRKIWLAHLVNEYSKPGELSDKEASLLSFASVLRVGDLGLLVEALKKAGLRNEEGLKRACVESVIGAIRVNRAFATGVNWSQPESK